MAKTKKKINLKDPSSKDQQSPFKSIFSDSPVYELLHYFEKAPDQWAARYILILTAIILRTAVGLGGHLGYHTPPLFGDFEAQRHWIELTLNLPVSKWYYFDLEYWGLDYPPLTAYHSYLVGIIGRIINSDWFALDTSRGIETDELRFFMRFMAILSELIIYIPAILSIANFLGKKFNVNRMDQIIISLVIINQAHLVLIDHGHFQFNSVMLGLFVYAVIDLAKGNLMMASIWFVSCINFKQMGLYYSLFIFFYILSQLKGFFHLVLVGITVGVTQFVYILPFLSKPESILQIIHRVFPLSRGLFEDKVANFWCTTNTIIKYRELMDVSDLAKLAIATTLVATLPINIMLFFKLKSKPDSIRIPGMIYGFAINSLAFYLFSFQVHEKSILVPLVPISLLLLIDHRNDINMIQWINNMGTFSLYPLLKKDDLIMQYFVTTLVINWLIGPKILLKSKYKLNNLAMWSTYGLMVIYHIIDFTIDPPKKYPDLWVILNITISFIGFIYFWLWLVYKVYKL